MKNKLSSHFRRLVLNLHPTQATYLCEGIGVYHPIWMRIDQLVYMYRMRFPTKKNGCQRLGLSLVHTRSGLATFEHVDVAWG